MIPYFASLGKRIASAYQGQPHTLPSIATGALRSAPPHEHTSLAEVMDWVATVSEPDFIAQRDPAATFGEPPITVFAGDGFCIDVNLWGTSTTQVHEHAFSGAFAVLEGSSLQCRYAYTLSTQLSPALALGELTFIGADHLQPGDTVAIRPRELIHSLFHLGMPSATVVVRTPGEAECLPQRYFDPPGLAIDGMFTLSAIASRRRQLVHFLASAAVEGGQQVLGSILERSTVLEAYLLLTEVLPPYWRAQGASAEQIDGVVTAAFDGMTWPDAQTHLALREAGRQRVNTGFHLMLRRTLADPGHRHVAAALLCAPSHTALLDILERLQPNRSPEEAVRDLASRLGLSLDTSVAGGGLPPSSLFSVWSPE